MTVALVHPFHLGRRRLSLSLETTPLNVVVEVIGLDFSPIASNVLVHGLSSEPL